MESEIYNKLVNITSAKKKKLIDKENKLAVTSWWGIPEVGEWQVKTIGCNLGSGTFVQCRTQLTFCNDHSHKWKITFKKQAKQNPFLFFRYYIFPD